MIYRSVAKLGWLLILGLVILPVWIWVEMKPISSRFDTLYLTLGSIGKIAGIVAFMMFCINIILTTRLRIFENLFGGLNKMFIAHHLTGALALCIILIHPITLALQKMTISARDGAIFLFPDPNDFAKTIGSLALWIFIVLMIVTFYINLPYRIWLITHKFLGIVLLLIGLHVILISSDTSNSLLLKAYLLIFLALASVAYIYRTLLPRFFVRRYLYTIITVNNPAENVARLVLKPLNKPMPYKSGQFVFISLQGEGLSSEWHPFSISSSPNTGNLEITVKSLGKYTDTLVRLSPSMIGMSVKIEGSYGKFNFRNFKSKHQIWIAGGIGITPFLGMISDIAEGYNVDLYYSVKNESEMINALEIEQIANQSTGKFRFIPHITDKSGFLTSNNILEKSGNIQDAEILLCGPPPMMRSIKDQLKKNGVKKSHIHSEEFSMQ